ncbi:MAG: LytTR family DNA-binding domain-containing protein [Saprospiraceae bacterium]|nr:LytTR family DNA-binding domain-containing protein [Saprospiraceae bacterium]
MLLRCMSVDDDILSRKTIEKHCSKVSNLDLVYQCENAEEGLKILEKDANIDLVFLDIEMPGLSGIEFLEEVKYMPIVIVTTSKTEYAFDAYHYEAIDYLKKPIGPKEFLRATDKAVEKHKQITLYKEESNAVYIKADGRFVRVPFEEILYFENVGDYVKVQTETQVLIIHSTLKGIDEKLKDGRFLKVHRSYIINLDKIVDIEENTMVIDKKVIPISRANKPVLMGRLNFL